MLGRKVRGRKTFNVALFDRVVRRIKTHSAEEFDMRVFLKQEAIPGAEPTLCRTVGCFAGTTVLVPDKPGRRLTKIEVNTMGVEYPVEDTAQKRLGLTDEEARQLFYTVHWPQEFRFKYFLAEGPKAKREEALKYFTHFRKEMIKAGRHRKVGNGRYPD